MPAIAIVDDHELIAEALRLALAGVGVDAVRIPPRELAELLDELRALRPDLVLLDLDLGEFGDTTPLIPSLVATGIRVLLVTGVESRLRIAAALEAGAAGYVPKARGFPVLLAQAQAALEKDDLVDPAERLTLMQELRVARAKRAAALAPFAQLTEREQAVLRELAKGRSVTDIARAWVVAEATVRSHVRGVLTKLDVGTQLAAVALALEVGWLQE